MIHKHQKQKQIEQQKEKEKKARNVYLQWRKSNPLFFGLEV